MEIRQNNFHNYCTQYSFVTKKVHHSYLKKIFFVYLNTKLKLNNLLNITVLSIDYQTHLNNKEKSQS